MCCFSLKLCLLQFRNSYGTSNSRTHTHKKKLIKRMCKGNNKIMCVYQIAVLKKRKRRGKNSNIKWVHTKYQTIKQSQMLSYSSVVL